MKNEQKNKELLNNKKTELENECSDTALDFVGDYALEDLHYLSDAFTEWADNNISVYYYDQFKFYEEHTTECENALLELYDGDSIADKIKNEGLYNLCCLAGVCGQYNEITGELYNHEEKIKKLLIIRHLLKNDIFIFNEEQLQDILDSAESSRIDEGWELMDIINDKLREIRDNLKKANYQQGKERARAKAQEWQRTTAETSQSWGAVAFATNYLHKLGKRYGLIKEFKENGIL